MLNQELAMKIDNRYEGANPRLPGDMVELSPNHWRLHPWSEDGDGNYKFCLNVKAVNDTKAIQALILEVEWADSEYMDCRDYLFIGRDEDWTFVPGRLEGTRSIIEMQIPPGQWYLSMHPVYDLPNFEEDRRRAIANGFQESVIGRSQGGREIVALSCGREASPAIFVVCRFHPYETAGSFCVSEMLRMLGQQMAQNDPILEKFRLVLVPMTNPDGVASGCCKRTQRGGPDICHVGTDCQDMAGQALAELLAAVKPAGYIDLHGWMYRNHDGMNWSNDDQYQELLSVLDGDPVFNKKWKGIPLAEYPDRKGDFALGAWRDHQASVFVISPSWFDRTVADMRHFGKTLLKSICAIIPGQ
jgi:Zinc carboxypeptidase